MIPVFKIKPADTYIWNLSELVDFLIAHQHQNIIIKNGTEGCCACTVGLYHWLDKFKFTHVTITTGNVLEKHPVYGIRYIQPWKFLNIQNSIEQNYHTWNKQFIFGTMYGRPLWHRLGIAAHLLTHHSATSAVGLAVDPKNQDSRELFELLELWKQCPESMVNFANIQHKLPLTHNKIADYSLAPSMLTDIVVSQTKQVYVNFLIDIVAETFTSGDCFFITEKTVRPMLLKKPMIVMGSKNYLEYLRQMGFRTFADFWDEDYDGYEGQDRYIKILKLIDNLATKSNQELETMYWNMQYTLDHNYNLLITQSYRKKIIAL